MGLRKYRDKRRFDRTSEPEGRLDSSPSGRLYVIHKHAASRLHYDFRLEMDGVLKSWAVPKGPNLNPSEKRLAVQVEDHPIEYGRFEGVIPENEYGGGTVMLWDLGQWEPKGDPRKGFQAGTLTFFLRGTKLKGLWTLKRMPASGKGESKNWLLFKRSDSHARTDSAVLEADPLSAVSGRSMDEIAQDRERVWLEGAEEAPAKPAGSSGKFSADDPPSLSGARSSPFPETAPPQLATLVDKLPAGDDWLHEIKFDGYRILSYKHGGKVQLVTRNGKDWTRRFAFVAEAVRAVAMKEGIVDGEVVVKRADGTTDFQALQNVLKGTGSGHLAYYLFDLLFLNGFDLRKSPLVDRKAMLQNLLKHVPADSPLQFSDHIRGGGPDVYRHACRIALEGIVSKRSDGLYRGKRTRDWLKIKCLHRQEFVIAGFTRPSEARIGFGALLLGYYDSAGNLSYAGKVGTGFNQTLLGELSEDLQSLRRETPALADPPSGYNRRGVQWVHPERVVEVEFAQWTADGHLRHPSFKGIREDKSPKEVVRETARNKATASPQKPQNSSGPAGRNFAADDGAVRIAGIRLTHPDRILYPEQGITKAELSGYYEQVADWILPHISGRPLTLVRCPQGRQKKCFYQKHLTDQLPDPIRGVAIREKKRERTYIVIDNLSGLIALVQLGTLELHPWGSRADRPDRPDRMVFDMDPGPGVSQADLIEGCRLLRDLLDGLGLKSFLKTSGGKGFHIVLPLVRRNRWDEVKAFTAAVTSTLAGQHPRRFVAVMTKAKRTNRIFVDYLRNGRGATSAAPYSPRARPGAPVSVPVRWDELKDDLEPDGYTLENLIRRLKALKEDPWSDFYDIRQSITATMKRALNIRSDPK